MAANTNTSVDTSGMRSAQDSFQTALTEVKGSYTQMESQIETLRGQWSGEASTGYLSAMETWLRDFDTVQRNLALMLQKLQDSIISYDSTHHTTSDVSSQLQKSMSAPLPGF